MAIGRKAGSRGTARGQSRDATRSRENRRIPRTTRVMATAQMAAAATRIHCGASISRPVVCPTVVRMSGMMTAPPSWLASCVVAQRALTRILNAEADKLECAVACIEDFDALVWLSQSVNRTLTDVAFLEQALYHELEQILDLCGPCLCAPREGPGACECP